MEDLLQEMRSLTVGADWRMSLSTALVQLNLRIEDYYRAVYMHSRPYGALNLPEEFGPENVSALVSVLHACGRSDAEEALFQAGYFLGPRRREQWRELFFSVIASKTMGKDVDRERLEIAFSGCSNFTDAALFYCESVFDREKLIEFGIDVYLEREGLVDEPHTRRTLLDALHEDFNSRRLRWSQIFAAVIEKLKERAGTWNMAFTVTRHIYDTALSKETRLALKDLGLAVEQLADEKKVKEAYRKKMLDHHPDRAGGNEAQACRINEAYLYLRSLNAVDSA